MKLYSKVIIGTLFMAAGFSVMAGEVKDKWCYTTNLNGFHETPPILSNGTGTFKASLDKSRTFLNFTLTFSNLSSSTNVSHIHFGHHNVAGAPVAFLCGGDGKPACPVAGGTVTGTISAADVVGVAAQGVTAGEFKDLLAVLDSGKAYVNVHTTTFPAGEIRGQVFKKHC